jgi:hypothetical protein
MSLSELYGRTVRPRTTVRKGHANLSEMVSLLYGTTIGWICCGNGEDRVADIFVRVALPSLSILSRQGVGWKKSLWRDSLFSLKQVILGVAVDARSGAI